MPKYYSLMKVEDSDVDGKPVTDKDSDFHKKQVLEKLVENKDKLKGYEITEQSRFLRHFTAKLKPLS